MSRAISHRCSTKGAVERRQVQRCGEVKERRFAIVEHRLQTLLRGTCEHGAQTRLVRVQRRSQRGDQGAVSRIPRQLLNLVQHQQGRTTIVRDPSDQVTEVQQQLARHFCLQGTEIDLRLGVRAGERCREAQLRRERHGVVANAIGPASFAQRPFERVQKHGQWRGRGLPERDVDHAVTKLVRHGRQIERQELRLAGASRREQGERRARPVDQQAQDASREFIAREVPRVDSHRKICSQA